LLATCADCATTSGNDASGYTYTAFGATLATTGQLDQPLRWKGRWFEPIAGGVYDMRARWWSPAIGAFLSVDDYAYHDTSSTLWGYPGQNPLRWSDPTGHSPWAIDERVWGAGVQVVVVEDISHTLDDQRPKLSGSGTADAAVVKTLGGQPVTLDGGGRITALGGVTFSHNFRDRVSGMQYASGSNTISEAYNYDSFMRRVERTHTETSPALSTQQFYGFDGANMVATIGPDASTKDAYLFDGTDHPLRLGRTAGTVVDTFYEVDLAGNVRRLRNGSGTDLGGYRYTAFGAAFAADAQTPAPAIDQPLRWKGRWFEPVAGGVYDMRARWWSPQMGAFLAIDAYAYHDPQSTLWGWPGENPLFYRDPTGRFGLVGAGIGLVAGGVGGYITGGWSGALAGGVAGGVVGLVNPFASSVVGAAAGAAAASALGQVLGNVVTGNPALQNFSVGAVAGAGVGSAAFAIGGGAAIVAGAEAEELTVATVVTGAADAVASGVGEAAGSKAQQELCK
jgi:RHS repeat-associated protein